MLDDALQACPSATTALTAKNCWLFELTIINTNAADVTMTITDGQASPVAFGPIVVQGTTATGGTAGQYAFASQNGVKFKSGIKIGAGTTGVNYSITAFAEGLSG